MNKYLYFKSEEFNSKEEFSNWVYTCLNQNGVSVNRPIDEGELFRISANIENENVIFYLGKDDEACEVPLLQIGITQRVPLIKKIFGKADYSATNKAKEIIDNLIQNHSGLIDYEWEDF